MPLNKATKKFFEQLKIEKQKNPAKPLNETSIEEFRAGFDAFTNLCGDSVATDYADKTISGSDGNEIPLRIYTQEGKGPCPVLVFFPAGGYCLNLMQANHDIDISLHNGTKIM